MDWLPRLNESFNACHKNNDNNMKRGQARMCCCHDDMLTGWWNQGDLWSFTASLTHSWPTQGACWSLCSALSASSSGAGTGFCTSTKWGRLSPFCIALLTPSIGCIKPQARWQELCLTLKQLHLVISKFIWEWKTVGLSKSFPWILNCFTPF